MQQESNDEPRQLEMFGECALCGFKYVVRSLFTGRPPHECDAAEFLPGLS